eukprot:6204905-Pleurochrysis_carterae.AAC.1
MASKARPLSANEARPYRVSKARPHHAASEARLYTASEARHVFYPSIVFYPFTVVMYSFFSLQTCAMKAEFLMELLLLSASLCLRHDCAFIARPSKGKKLYTFSDY